METENSVMNTLETREKEKKKKKKEKTQTRGRNRITLIGKIQFRMTALGKQGRNQERKHCGNF